MKKNLLCLLILLCFLCTSCAQSQPSQEPPSTSEDSVSSEIPHETAPAPEQDTEPVETPLAPSEPQDAPEPQNADFYSVCTSLSKDEVEQFAREVKDLILTSNWTALSEHIAYPITMGGIVYEDSASFVTAPFETLLGADAIETIQNENCTDMFCKYSGIMMGNGEVWIGEVLDEDGNSAGLRVIGLSILEQG
ncbi:MAG: hypothetical protein J6A88_01900 [Oscillospiraceae bacterium]|nr:hypothetical protein [Oscillospiraceae bacterium]